MAARFRVTIDRAALGGSHRVMPTDRDRDKLIRKNSKILYHACEIRLFDAAFKLMRSPSAEIREDEAMIESLTGLVRLDIFR